MGSHAVEQNLLSEDFGPQIPVPTQTLHQILNKSVQDFPERTALVSCHQSPNYLYPASDSTQNKEHKGYLRLSYAQLDAASKTLASYLTQSGVVKGDAIVVMVKTCAEWALCFWAAVRLGCPFVPINPAIVSRANEIQHVLSSLERIGVLVANDESIVRLLSGNALSEVKNCGIRLVLGKVGMVEWTAFDNALVQSSLPDAPAGEHAMGDTALIVLTSGTTALPKGCPHSNSTVASMCARHQIIYSLDETRVSCNHMPLFHLAGVMESLWAWAHGSAVVYPKDSFDARATLDAIDGERCTDMCLVPSMLRATIDHPALSTRDTKSLRLIKLAANDVLGSDARACSELLHAKVVTNAFGMTETSCMTDIFAWKDGLCKDSEPFPVGRMAPGAKARVCAPGSHEPVKRGTIGELHLGGGTITDRYIGGEDQSSFYKDKEGLWHVSGDRAMMAESGELTMLGRYKDVINRAGENISPLVMERVLNRQEGVKSCQVVGVPDDIAGEVPVAVIETTEDGTDSKHVLHDQVVKDLGVTFALERVFDLKELAVDRWPTTATGKVRKASVRQLVLDHLDCESKGSAKETTSEPTQAALTRIWARFSGVPENHLSPTMSLEGMVDSVTVMRFRSQVKKELGKSISLEELNANPTIIKQAAILDSRQGSSSHRSEAQAELARVGPPTLEDVVHARGDHTLFDEVRQAAEEKLQILGLSWEQDVEEVLPMYDFLQAWRDNISIMFRIAFMTAKSTTKEVRSALETVLPEHGMLRTVLVQTPSTGQSWMMIRSSKRWFDLMIKDCGTLRTEEDLLTLDLSYRDASGSMDSKPLPMFYITVCFIEATQSAGLVVYGDHSSYDAHSVLSLFAEDLSKMLSKPGIPLPSRPKYNLFANAYFNGRTSIPAQLRLAKTAASIKGISERHQGLWPKESFKSVNGSPSRHADHLLLKGTITPGLAGLTKHIKIDMSTNKYLTVHKIPHIIALKAAIAIYNTQQTGHPYAFFSNLQMARSYPFVDRAIAAYLPDIMDMPGATIQAPISNLYLPPTKPLSELMHAINIAQNTQTANAQYPVGSLLGILPQDDVVFLLHSLFGRQAFNYNPVTTPDPGAVLRNVQFAGNANLSIMWWCGMVDSETVQMRVTWNDEVFGVRDVEGAMEGFERNLKWIAEGGNWEKGVGECGK